MESSDFLLADGVPVRSKVVSQGDGGGAFAPLSSPRAFAISTGPLKNSKIPLTDFTSNKAQ